MNRCKFFVRGRNHVGTSPQMCCGIDRQDDRGKPRPSVHDFKSEKRHLIYEERAKKLISILNCLYYFAAPI
jgi:hypothetical protein